MAKQWQTYYSSDWEKEEDFKFIQPVPPTPTSHEKRPTSVRCTLCQKSVNLRNMGKRAVTTHVNTATHKKAVENHKTNYGIKLFTSPTPSTTSSTIQVCDVPYVYGALVRGGGGGGVRGWKGGLMILISMRSEGGSPLVCVYCVPASHFPQGSPRG